MVYLEYPDKKTEISLCWCFINLFIFMNNEASKSIHRGLHKEISSLFREPRSLSIPIQAPVLNQYNYIDLRKDKRNRIDRHIIMNDLPLLNKSKSNDSTQRDKWQKSLDRYILAKEKLQTRQVNISNEFEFLKLNKINKYRKKKLVEANFLPISIINTTDLHENYSFDLTQVEHEFRHSMKMKERGRRRRFNTEKDASHAQTPKDNKQLSQKLTEKNRDKSQQQERIMNSLLQNYFKKKYSQQISKISPKLKINKYNSAILRKNKRKQNP